MLKKMEIITPLKEHAKEICDLLIESIQTNCAPDYNNDPEIMKEWLSNKTPDNISQWICSKDNISIAALHILENKLTGFALMNTNGEILLNYVLPKYIREGIGKSLLSHLEKIAEIKSIESLSVISTITAKKFYESNGFTQNGEPEQSGDISGDFPLIKHLNISMS